MKTIGIVHVLGMPITVHRCIVSDDVLEADTHACYVCDECAIYINDELNSVPERIWENIVHEIVHAWIEACGVHMYLRSLLHIDTKVQFDPIEENMVRMLSPAISSSLKDIEKLRKKVLA